MKLAVSARARRPMIDMVPMINFAFLLLIFFVLAGKSGRHGATDAALPHAASAVTATAAAGEVKIDAQGNLLWDGAAIADAELLAQARAWHSQHASGPLRLSAMGTADAVRVLQVLQALRAAGVTDVVLATA